MGRRSHLVAWAVAVGAIAAACGGAVSLAPRDGGAAVDTGGSDGGEDGAASETGGGFGWVSITNIRNSETDASDWGNGLTAAFYEAQPPSPSCLLPPWMPDGGCEVVPLECPDGGTTGAPVSAGTLTLLGAASGPISAMPGSDGTYDLPLDQGYLAHPLLPPGSSVGISASGAVAPAFANRTFLAPPAITITSPPLDVRIPTTHDVVFTWTGGIPGAQVNLVFPSGSPASAVICGFDAMAGQGLVPQAVVANLAGPPGQAPILNWWQISRTTFTVGNWTMQLSGGTNEWQAVPPCEQENGQPCEPCGPSNCPYCCNTAGACMWGTGDTACGSGGIACIACTGGQHYLNQSCQ